jgi:hypothetical protein
VNKRELTEESVAHLAVALKALPENRETPLEALIQPACRYLLACREAAQIEKKNTSESNLKNAYQRYPFI